MDPPRLLFFLLHSALPLSCKPRNSASQQHGAAANGRSAHPGFRLQHFCLLPVLFEPLLTLSTGSTCLSFSCLLLPSPLSSNSSFPPSFSPEASLWGSRGILSDPLPDPRPPICDIWRAALFCSSHDILLPVSLLVSASVHLPASVCSI